jgi:hypothetical protein
MIKRSGCAKIYFYFFVIKNNSYTTCYKYFYSIIFTNCMAINEVSSTVSCFAHVKYIVSCQ